MLGRRESLRELIRNNHEEITRYLDKRDEEFRVHQAELHRLREKAEGREEETREFTREILLRNEKVYKAVVVELEKGAKQLEKGTRQLEEGTKQIQANTQAVLSVLDRLDKAA